MYEVLLKNPESGPINIGKTLEYAQSAEWQTCPPLVIAENDLYMPSAERSTPQAVIDEAHRMVDKIASDFESVGSNVFHGRKHGLTGEDAARAQSIGIFFAGELPSEAVTNIADPFLDSKQVVKANQDIVPQIERYMDIAVVRQFKKLKIKDGDFEAHPGSFRTLAMVEDPSGIIKYLSQRGYEGDFESDHRLEAYIRQLLARHGTLSTILRTWRKNDLTGQVEFDNPILCTLEGGHPQVTSDEELSVRLMEIGSSRTLEIEREIHPTRIDRVEERTKNPAVKDLQNFMWFLGGLGAFASRVDIEDMVATYNPAYVEYLIGFVNWAGQAEGAGGVRVPSSSDSLWSASGRFEAVKTDLQFDDIIATTPWPEGWSTKQKREMAVRVVQLAVSQSLIERMEREVYKHKFLSEVYKHKFPSIESGPLTYAAVRLDEAVREAVAQGIIAPLKFIKTKEGYIPDINGSAELSAVTGWVHMHRSFKIIDPTKVNLVSADIRRYPAVPCGTVAERDMFFDAMFLAWKGWEEGGRKAVASVFYMPNHGMLLMPHPTANDKGIIPENPFELTKQAIQSGALELLDGVYQDNSAFAVSNYYSE